MINFVYARGDRIKRNLIIFLLITAIITTVIIFRIEKDNPVFNQEKELYSPKGLPSGSEAKYEIHLEMDSFANFKVQSMTTVKNLSADKWNYLIFYFVPNMFTEENYHTSFSDFKIHYSISEDLMEYPGVVTANSINSTGPVKSDTLKRLVVHEIAHQWFYGI